MVGNKVYYKARFSSDGFISDKKSLFLGKDELKSIEKHCEIGRFVDKKNQIQSMPMKDFYYDSEINEIKRVVSLVNNSNESLLFYQEYSVYNVLDSYGVKKYEIVDSNYKESAYECSFFISKEEFDKIKQEPNGEIKLKEKAVKIYEEMELIKSKEKDSNNIREVLNIINSYKINSKTKKDIEESKKSITSALTKMKNSVWSFICILLTLPLISNFKIKLLFIYSALIIVTFILKGFFNKFYDTCVKDIDVYNDLLEFNSVNNKIELFNLPDDILSKIKRIEILIEQLIEKNVDKDIIKLVKSNISLSSIMVIKNETDESKQELIELLENSIKYCNSLLENKDGEKEFIKNSLAKNISDTIKNNNELIKSMIDDNNNLYKKNEEPSK